MLLNWYRDLGNQESHASPRRHGTAARRKPFYRPQLELLEGRITPNVHTWTGGGGLTNQWSDGNNWIGGIPTAQESNLQLIFQLTRVGLGNTNDLGGLTVASIQFNSNASGYQISGFPLTFTGNTTITAANSAGTNSINVTLNQQPFLSGQFAFYNHVFNVAPGGTLQIGGQITGAPLLNLLHKTGAGVLNLARSNDYGGETLVDAGTLQVGSFRAVPSTSAVTVAAGARFDLNNFNDIIGSLTGPAGASVTLGTADLTTGVDNTSTTFSGGISGPGRFFKNGTGTFTLGGVNDYTGGTFIRAGGPLELGVDYAVPAAGGVGFVEAGARFDLNNHNEAIGSLTGPAGSSVTLGTLGTSNLFTGQTNESTVFSGVISGNGNLHKRGTGTFVLGGLNTYGGITAIVAGTLTAGVSNAVPAGSRVIVNAGATLDIHNVSNTIGTLEGSGNVFARFGFLATDGDDRFPGFAGVISGTAISATNVQVAKQGTGTLTLSGQNTYSGATQVNAGTLAVLVNNAIPATRVFVDTAGRIDLRSRNDIFGSLTGNGTVILGNGVLTTGVDNTSTTFSGVINGNGEIIKRGTGTFTLSGNSPSLAQAFVSGGILSVTGVLPNTPFTVNTGTILGGTGRVGRLTATTGSTVSPGTTNPGSFRSGNATLAGGSVFRVRLNGTGPRDFDQLNVSGTVDLNGAPTLDASLNFASAVGDTFTILTSSGSISGTFNALPDGALFPLGGSRFQISYTGTSVVLTHIADPADHFVISAPASAAAGVPFDITVTALDPNGNVDPTYTGTVSFTSSDTDKAVSLPADYTFTTGTGADNGVHAFTDTGLGETTLITLGDQDIAVNDGAGLAGTTTVTVTAGAAAPRGNPQGGLSVLDRAFLAATSVFDQASASRPLIPTTASAVSQGSDAASRILDAPAVNRLFALEPEGQGLAVSRWQHATRRSLGEESVPADFFQLEYDLA